MLFNELVLANDDNDSFDYTVTEGRGSTLRQGVATGMQRIFEFLLTL